MTGEKDAAENAVQCARCERLFDEAYPGGAERGQGYECACEVRDDLIRGHYGSTRHDMDIYRADEPLELPYGAPVCDDCVDDSWAVRSYTPFWRTVQENAMIISQLIKINYCRGKYGYHRRGAVLCERGSGGRDMSIIRSAMSAGAEVVAAVGRDEDEALIILVGPDCDRMRSFVSPLRMTAKRGGGMIRLRPPQGAAIIIDAEAELDLRTAPAVRMAKALPSGLERTGISVQIDWDAEP